MLAWVWISALKPVALLEGECETCETPLTMQVNRWKFAILKWPPKRSEQIEGLFMINWVNLVDQNSFLHRSFNIWYTAQKIA